MSHPIVAIVGRMNVGKSTLFNRLTDSHTAIVSSWAGTTRDVKSAEVIWRGTAFTITDTGGLDVEDDEQLEERVIRAARRSAQTADLVLFVVDGQAGVLPNDKRIAKELSALDVPILLVVNKVDNAKNEIAIPGDVYKLCIDDVAMVSAKNGRQSGDLLDKVYEMIRPQNEPEDVNYRTKVAIVGRPNVGKSSLLNAILGEERVIVADKAHTTRDTNDIPYSYNGREFLLIDTAGIRKRSAVGQRWVDKRLGVIEKHSVSAAIRAMQKADVVLLVLESQKHVTAQDKKIVDLANQYGKGLIMVINKWDLIEEKDSNTITEFTDYFRDSLPFLAWAPMIFVSATERLRVLEVLNVVLRVTENYERQLSTELLEPILSVASSNYKPKQSSVRKFKKRISKLQRLEQVSTKPPHFYLKASRPEQVPPALPKIIERELRHRYDFNGVRINIEVGR